MERYKEVLIKVFQKYRRMQKIAANPIDPKVTQSFDTVVVQGGLKENIVEKLVIKKADAEAYIYLIDQAIKQLSDTDERPYQRIIIYKYKNFYSAQRIAIMIGYSVQHYFVKLKEAQKELCEIIDLWGIDYN